jgi:hypothetical protein
MATYKRGEVVGTIIRALRETGPMTLADMVALTGKPKGNVHNILRATMRETTRPAMPKRVHIADWVYDQEGQKRYPRALYALGNYPDAVKPKTDDKATGRRYRDKRRKQRAMSSVFNLATLVRGYKNAQTKQVSP